MYIDSVALDINKTAQEIIIDKVNAVNGLQLNFDDFVFEDPQVYSGTLYPQANTSVKIVPKTTSQFYNDFTVYYKRMAIADILDNDEISISRDSADNLSDLIDAINLAYNIHLVADDYYDSPIAAADPLDPNAEVPVMFTCQVTSFLFTGSYMLTLNRVATQPVAPILESADVYIVLDQPYEAIHKSNIVCKTSLGESVTNFVFMRNCNTISKVKINEQFRIKDLGIVLIGDFEFNANLTGTAQDYITNCVLMSPQGKILSVMNNLFGADNFNSFIKCSDSQLKYLYVIDPTDTLGSEVTQLYRYTENGALDNGFSLIGPSYKVIYSKIDSQGRIYVCSELLTITEDIDNNPATPDVAAHQYWIERFLEDGSKDTSFTTVKLRITGSGNPWPVACIDPIENDASTTTSGAYIGFAMLEQPDSLGMSPIVNGVPFIAGGETKSYGFLPILKVNNAGVMDINFNVKKPAYAPKAVYDYEYGQAPSTGDNFVTAIGNNVAMLTYRQNPITGNQQYIPMIYDSLGALKRVSGDEYYQSYYWVTAHNLISLKQNSLIVFGSCKLPDGNGGYLDERDMVCGYDPKSQNQGIIYQTVDTVNGTPSIQDLLIYEGA